MAAAHLMFLSTRAVWRTFCKLVVYLLFLTTLYNDGFYYIFDLRRTFTTVGKSPKDIVGILNNGVTLNSNFFADAAVLNQNNNVDSNDVINGDSSVTGVNNNYSTTQVPKIKEIGGQVISNVNPVLYGFRIDTKDAIVAYDNDGSITVSAESRLKIRVYGLRLHAVERVRLTVSDVSCEHAEFETSNLDFVDTESRQFQFFAKLQKNLKTYHFCFCTNGGKDNEETLAADKELLDSKPNNNNNSSDPEHRQQQHHHFQCTHQGRTGFTSIRTRPPVKEYYLPVPLQITIIAVLMVLSGLFSGLNLGLMSLDKTELKIILKVGDANERKFAKKIYPIRKSGNYLLCTLLLGNVVVNSGISILFDDLTSGYIALIFSSLGIVVFGEIIPQAVCSRYGLAAGAYTSLITRFFMIFTFPLSWPISKILDKVLGEEVRQVYNRERLLELIRLSKEDQAGDLGTCQEVQIVTGALELSKKSVGDVMTPINNVFMLSSDVILDPKSVSEIVKSGFTRIPVYEPNNRNNIVNMLNVKDLALLDPEDKIPLTTICQFYHHPVRFVMRDTPLSVMLEEFKKGHYHLAIVQQISAEGEGDPVYEAAGLITLEDIIEEIIQSEIRDEFDIIRDSRVKRLKRRETQTFVAVAAFQTGRSANVPSDVTIFFNQSIDACDVSPQLTLAAYQYLTTTLDAFRTDFISENVLQRLIRQNVLRKKVFDASADSLTANLYTKNKECNYFILILEGKCTIVVGESNLLFEAGPFCYFGYELLSKITEDIKRRTSFAAQQQQFMISSNSNLNSAVTRSVSVAVGPQTLTLAATSTTAPPPGGAPPSLAAAPNPALMGVAAVAAGANAAAASPVDVGGKKFAFTPDFTLTCNRTDLVYLKITASAYTKAYRATLIEMGRMIGSGCFGFGQSGAGGNESALNSPEEAAMHTHTSNPSSPPRPRAGTSSRRSSSDPPPPHVTQQQQPMGKQSTTNHVTDDNQQQQPIAARLPITEASHLISTNNSKAAQDAIKKRFPHIGGGASNSLSGSLDSAIKEEQDDSSMD